MANILIVEDEEVIHELIKRNLSLVGHICHSAFDGKEALECLADKRFDLMILDIMLPKEDGFSVMRQAKGQPTIFLTARDSLNDRMTGFSLGADDYIIKPFDSKELVARVKAVLRRFQAARPIPSAQPNAKCVEYPDLIINLTNYSVIYQGMTIDMPPKELELLYFLASSPNQVFTREQLLDHIWGYEYIGDTRTVDVHIKRLREKIKDHPSWSISTVWGIGYKFEVKS